MVRFPFCILVWLLCIGSWPAFAYESKEEYCSDRRPAPIGINIELELPDPYYDFKKSIDDINIDRSGLDEWIVRNGMQQVWQSKEMTRLGYAAGGMATMSSMHLTAKHYDRYGVYYCTYVSKIDIAMMFRTMIVIPKNFKRNGCRFNHVHEHELLHYQTNRDVVRKFVERLYRDLPVIIAHIENSQPYVPKAEVQNAFKRLQENIKFAVESYILDSMRIELDRQNALIDTPEEYASSGEKLRACKD